MRDFAELIAHETRGGAELVEYALKVLRSKRGKDTSKQWAVGYLTERMLGRAPQSVEAKVETCDDRSDVYERLRARLTALVMADVAPEGCESPSAPEGDKGDNPGLNRTGTETCLQRN